MNALFVLLIHGVRYLRMIGCEFVVLCSCVFFSRFACLNFMEKEETNKKPA